MKQMSKFKKCWLLFINTFLISASTNGGYAITSVMKTKFVEKYKWLSEDEMLDLLSLGQSAPGPIAINTSVLVGYRAAGILGSIVTLLGTVLPPLIIMCLVTTFYTLISSNEYVRTFMRAMQPAVAALLISVSIDLYINLSKRKSVLAYILVLVCFLVNFYSNISVFYIALTCGLIGFLFMNKEKKHE